MPQDNPQSVVAPGQDVSGLRAFFMPRQPAADCFYDHGTPLHDFEALSPLPGAFGSAVASGFSEATWSSPSPSFLNRVKRHSKIASAKLPNGVRSSGVLVSSSSAVMSSTKV